MKDPTLNYETSEPSSERSVMNLKRDLELLLLFKREEAVSIPMVVRAVGIPYQTTDSIFRRWINK